MLFGDILRNLLENYDISQKQLATDLNIAPSTLGNYIRNIREPDFETVKVIATYFNCSIDYLLDYHSGSAKTTNEEEILRLFRALSSEYQEIFLEQGKALLKYFSDK